MEWDVYHGKMNAAMHLAIDDKLFERAKQGRHSLLLPEYTQDSIVLSKRQHPSDYIGNGNPGVGDSSGSGTGSRATSFSTSGAIERVTRHSDS